MNADIVTPQDLSKDLLFKVFDDAYMDPVWDKDGDVQIRDRYSAYILPAADGREIMFLTVYGCSPGVEPEQKYQYVNSVNAEVKLIRAYVRKTGAIAFDFYICVEGGVTKAAIVRAAKRFFNCLDSALRQEGHEVIW